MKQMGKWKVLTLLAMASFITFIDLTAMSVSISSLVNDLNTNIGGIQWIVSTYTLTIAVSMLPIAKLTEKICAKKMFISGVCLYGAGTLTAAFAQNTTVLFFGWAFMEGVAATLIMSSGLFLLRTYYKEDDLTIAIPVYAISSAASIAIGPVFGGIISTILSWRYVFGLEALVVIYILLNIKTINSIKYKSSNKKANLDIIGLTLLAFSFLFFIHGLLMSKTYGWVVAKQPYQLGDFKLAGVSIAFVFIMIGVLAFVVVNFRIRNMVVSKEFSFTYAEIFLNKTYRSILVINVLTRMIMIGILFIVPIYLQNLLRYTPMETGLIILPLSAAVFLTSSAAIKLGAAIGERLVIALGCSFTFLGVFYLFFHFGANFAISGSMFMPALALIGLGIGLCLSLSNKLGISQLDKKHEREGYGLMSTAYNLGSSIITALAGSLLISGVVSKIFERFSKLPEYLNGVPTKDLPGELTTAFLRMQFSNYSHEALTSQDINSILEISLISINRSMQVVFALLMALALTSIFVALINLPRYKIEKEQNKLNF